MLGYLRDRHWQSETTSMIAIHNHDCQSVEENSLVIDKAG